MVEGPSFESPARTRDFSLHENRPDRLLGTPSLLFNGKWGFLPGHEVNHSTPYSAEVKNEWSCTSTPLIYLYGVDRDSFTHTFY